MVAIAEPKEDARTRPQGVVPPPAPDMITAQLVIRLYPGYPVMT